jgi:KDEL-tailed cysteine endopeptidase
MNTTKIALVLGVTLLSMLGALHYLKSSSDFMPMTSLEDKTELFSKWMIKYDKKYSVDEHHFRFAIFSKTYDIVQAHNAKGLSWEQETNQFADLTDEEFAALHLGYNHDPNRVRENVVYLDETEAPEGTSWDWRKKGAVTAVKDQGSCGSCYTFASVVSLEGLMFITKGELVELSNQQLLDCTSSYGNQGCQGGLMVPCYKYTKEKGIEKFSDYSYKGKVATCAFAAAKVVFKNGGYAEVPKNDFTQLRAAVKKVPTSVAVMANNDAFKNYKSGIISANCGTELDHAITAVGYGSGFWIIKNSWGTAWGEEGYVRIASGSQNNGAGVCGVNSDNSYPTA